MISTHNIAIRRQGGVTPIDSIVITATAVSKWSMVKAVQKGAVNSQSTLKSKQSTVKTCSEATRTAAKRQVWVELLMRSKTEIRIVNGQTAEKGQSRS